MVAQAFNLSTWETEAGRSLGSRPPLSTEPVPGQPHLHRKALLQKIKTKQNRKPRYSSQNYFKKIKFVWKYSRPQKATAIFRRKKKQCLEVPVLKLYYKAKIKF